MTKVYARQVPPEYQESPLYYSEWPENIYVFGNDRLCGRGAEMIESIKNSMYDAAEELKQIATGRSHYNSFVDIIADILPAPDHKKEYSRADRLEWRRLLLAYDAGAICDDDATTTALKIITGQEYDAATIRGCCQSDWQNVIYPAVYGPEWLEAFETEYFNTGSEWTIHDDETPPECAEDISGYNVYCLGWNDEKIRAEIAEYSNVKPENVILYSFSGWSRAAAYREA